jgi:hypothetical protein
LHICGLQSSGKTLKEKYLGMRHTRKSVAQVFCVQAFAHACAKRWKSTLYEPGLRAHAQHAQSVGNQRSTNQGFVRMRSMRKALEMRDLRHAESVESQRLTCQGLAWHLGILPIKTYIGKICKFPGPPLAPAVKHYYEKK